MPCCALSRRCLRALARTLRPRASSSPRSSTFETDDTRLSHSPSRRTRSCGRGRRCAGPGGRLDRHAALHLAPRWPGGEPGRRPQRQPPIQVFCRRTPERHLRVHSIDSATPRPSRPSTRSRTTATRLALRAAQGGSLPGRPGRAADKAKPGPGARAAGSRLEITLCARAKARPRHLVDPGRTILAALSVSSGGSVMDELIRQVLQVEQMLTTGGAAGSDRGAVAGSSVSRAGPASVPTGDPPARPVPVRGARELACYSLFYTGLTRLAKNILPRSSTR